MRDGVVVNQSDWQNMIKKKFGLRINHTLMLIDWTGVSGQVNDANLHDGLDDLEFRDAYVGPHEIEGNSDGMMDVRTSVIFRIKMFYLNKKGKDCQVR